MTDTKQTSPPTDMGDLICGQYLVSIPRAHIKPFPALRRSIDSLEEDEKGRKKGFGVDGSTGRTLKYFAQCLATADYIINGHSWNEDEAPLQINTLSMIVDGDHRLCPDTTIPTTTEALTIDTELFELAYVYGIHHLSKTATKRFAERLSKGRWTVDDLWPIIEGIAKQGTHGDMPQVLAKYLSYRAGELVNNEEYQEGLERGGYHQLTLDLMMELHYRANYGKPFFDDDWWLPLDMKRDMADVE